ncbi:hypothetical protein TNCV_4511251 [Trichonephila clavipes]|nr:hypothetical protein TNCV_4511251 [Trichonephila clavipes]
MSDMSIDDVLTGAETFLEAKELKNQLINIFAKGDTINREWRQFVESLQIVNDININRCIVVEQPEVIELHGFSDASQSAHGAVVYYKFVTSDGRVLVHLLPVNPELHLPSKQRFSDLSYVPLCC